jgi:hypothetical protein
MDCKSWVIAMLVSALSTGAALAADAPPAASAPSVCLEPSRIDHTTVLDDKTILFKMRDGTIWRNDLPQKCYSLKIENGFAYEVQGDSICSNLQTIRVLRSHNTCFLGAFTPYTPPAPPSQ